MEKLRLDAFLNMGYLLSVGDVVTNLSNKDKVTKITKSNIGIYNKKYHYGSDRRFIVTLTELSKIDIIMILKKNSETIPVRDDTKQWKEGDKCVHKNSETLLEVVCHIPNSDECVVRNVELGHKCILSLSDIKPVKTAYEIAKEEQVKEAVELLDFERLCSKKELTVIVKRLQDNGFFCEVEW